MRAERGETRSQAFGNPLLSSSQSGPALQQVGQVSPNDSVDIRQRIPCVSENDYALDKLIKVVKKDVVDKGPRTNSSVKLFKLKESIPNFFECAARRPQVLREEEGPSVDEILDVIEPLLEDEDRKLDWVALDIADAVDSLYGGHGWTIYLDDSALGESISPPPPKKRKLSPRAEVRNTPSSPPINETQERPRQGLLLPTQERHGRPRDSSEELHEAVSTSQQNKAQEILHDSQFHASTAGPSNLETVVSSAPPQVRWCCPIEGCSKGPADPYHEKQKFERHWENSHYPTKVGFCPKCDHRILGRVDNFLTESGHMKQAHNVFYPGRTSNRINLHNSLDIWPVSDIYPDHCNYCPNVQFSSGKEARNHVVANHTRPNAPRSPFPHNAGHTHTKEHSEHEGDLKRAREFHDEMQRERGRARKRTGCDPGDGDAIDYGSDDNSDDNDDDESPSTHPRNGKARDPNTSSSTGNAGVQGGQPDHLDPTLTPQNQQSYSCEIQLLLAILDLMLMSTKKISVNRKKALTYLRPLPLSSMYTESPRFETERSMVLFVRTRLLQQPDQLREAINISSKTLSRDSDKDCAIWEGVARVFLGSNNATPTAYGLGKSGTSSGELCDAIYAEWKGLIDSFCRPGGLERLKSGMKIPFNDPVTRRTTLNWMQSARETLSWDLSISSIIDQCVASYRNDLSAKITLNSLHVVRPLGRGSYGVVDEVLCESTRQTYARKIIPWRKRKRSNFSSEISILQALRHPHIIKFVGAYESNNLLSIFMQPVAQGDLSTYLDEAHFGTPHFQNMSPLNRGPLWKWFHDLASALQYLHDNDIVHGDIKPKNILVSGNEVYICDFGSARYAKDISNGENGSILGITPKYSAPEVSTSTGNPLWSTKADVFSLGCVFAEVITVYSGQSVKAFDNFRRVGLGCCAFHANIPETYLWIDSLCVPEDICYACFYSVSRSIKDMLIMDPARRPGTKDLMCQLRPACSAASSSKSWNSSGLWNDLESNSSQNSNFCNANLSCTGAGPFPLEKTGPGGSGSRAPQTSALDISCPLFEYEQILRRLNNQVKLPGESFNPGEAEYANAWESLLGGATSLDGIRYSAQNVAFGKEGFGFLYEIYGTMSDYLNLSRLSKRSLGNSKVVTSFTCSTFVLQGLLGPPDSLKSINYSWTQSPKALENLNTLEDMFLETPPSMHEDIAAFWNGLFDTIWALELLYSPVNESKVHHFDIKPSNILVHHQINASPRKFGISDVDISKFGIFEGMESIIEEPEPDKADHDRESSNADNWGEGVTDDESCQMCHFHRNISPAYVKGNIDIWSLGYVFSEAARWLVLGYRGLESHRRHRIPKPGCPLDLRNLQEASNSESKYDSATYASTKAFLRVLGEEADPITKIICDEIIPGMFEHSDGMTGLAGIWRTAKGVTKGAPRSLDGLSQTHEKVGATTSDPLQGTIPHDDDTRSKTRSNSGDFLYRFQNATGVSKKGTRKAWPRLNGLTQTATKSKANTTSHRPRSTGLIWSKQPIERFIREERDYRSRAVEAYDSHQQAAKYLHIERLRQCMQAID